MRAGQDLYHWPRLLLGFRAPSCLKSVSLLPPSLLAPRPVSRVVHVAQVGCHAPGIVPRGSPSPLQEGVICGHLVSSSECLSQGFCTSVLVTLLIGGLIFTAVGFGTVSTQGLKNPIGCWSNSSANAILIIVTLGTFFSALFAAWITSCVYRCCVLKASCRGPHGSCAMRRDLSMPLVGDSSVVYVVNMPNRPPMLIPGQYVTVAAPAYTVGEEKMAPPPAYDA